MDNVDINFEDFNETSEPSVETSEPCEQETPVEGEYDLREELVENGWQKTGWQKTVRLINPLNTLGKHLKEHWKEYIKDIRKIN